MRQAQFALFGIPVRIETNVLFLSLFIGMQIGLDAIYLVAAFLFSILLHELGHALMFRRYGCSSFISIHGLGGTTSSPAGHSLSSKQHIMVSLAGPLSQLALLGIPSLIARSVYGPYGYGGWILSNLVYINVGWALLNLLPIYPLDGGQVLREVLTIRKAVDPRRTASIVAIVVGTPTAIAAYFYVGRFAAILIAYVVIRGALDGRTRRSNTIEVAAAQARASHRQSNIKGPDRDAALAEAYNCLVEQNTMRLATLVNHLQTNHKRGNTDTNLVTLRGWDAALYGNASQLPAGLVGDLDRTSTPSKSVLLHMSKLAVTGDEAAIAQVGSIMIQSLASPEVMPAVVLLAKHDQLARTLRPVSDEDLSLLVDTLVAAGMPQQQMAVSRIQRLRREAAQEGS